MKKNSKSTKKGVLKGDTPPIRDFRLLGKTFFLTFKGIPKMTKETLRNFLLNNPLDRSKKVEKYLISEQMYDSGEPHFHAIITYPTRKEIIRQDYYDFLDSHPNIQLMRNLKAALVYMQKQDPNPLTNMDLHQQKRKARAKDTSSLYELLEQQMLKDPFNFNVMDYCKKYDLGKQIYKANYSKAITLLKGIQEATCRQILRDKPGTQLIDRSLIEFILTPGEIKQYDSHPCYKRIVDHINEIYCYPNRNHSTRAPDKTKHLYLVGPVDVGKTALVTHNPSPLHPQPGLDHYFSTYYLNLAERYFPPYQTFMSSVVYWDQFVINSTVFPKSRYNQLLTYLSGAPCQIPIKGRLPVRRKDNPKHILTSNLTLEQQICRVFKSEENRAKARANLRARIDEVIIPKGHNIHLLRKLFLHPNPPTDNN